MGNWPASDTTISCCNFCSYQDWPNWPIENTRVEIMTMQRNTVCSCGAKNQTIPEFSCFLALFTFSAGNLIGNVEIKQVLLCRYILALTFLHFFF